MGELEAREKGRQRYQDSLLCDKWEDGIIDRPEDMGITHGCTEEE